MGREKASTRKKGKPKTADPERQIRRDVKKIKQQQAGLDRTMRKIKEMSGIVGLDGKTPIRLEQKSKDKAKESEFHYMAGGLRFGSSVAPDAMLQSALERSQQMIGQQAYNKALSERKNAQVAQVMAVTAVSTMTDPFAMEPCAAAVFMYLSRELEYRDSIIAQMNERLQGLGAKPLDLTHPYPLPLEKPEVEDADTDAPPDDAPES